MSAEDWRQFGLCGQTDPELFFSGIADDVIAAKKLCHICPSQKPCLDDALSAGENDGIRGGMTAAERQKMPEFTPVSAISEFLPQTDAQVAAAFERREADDGRRFDARRKKAAAGALSEIHPLDRQVER